MRWTDRLRLWERAMEDIEDPRGIELRDCRDRLRQLEAEQVRSTSNAGARQQ
jgi:hypothetical protein